MDTKTRPEYTLCTRDPLQGASLVAQWLGVRLPIQGTRVRAPCVSRQTLNHCTTREALASLYLLIGAFNPFTFKVIIDMYVPITIFSIVYGLFL